MANALVHEVSVESRRAVDTVDQLIDALKNECAGCSDELDNTYMVELLREVLSDKSVKYSIRIREAEAV